MFAIKAYIENDKNVDNKILWKENFGFSLWKIKDFNYEKWVAAWFNFFEKLMIDFLQIRVFQLLALGFSEIFFFSPGILILFIL